MSLHDQGKMFVAPVKLRREQTDLPHYFKDTQYARWWEYPDPGALVDSLIRSYDADQAARSNRGA